MANPKTIFIVEDDANFQLIFKDRLTDEGYIVNQATNGTEALYLIKQAKPQLIIIDIMIPGKMNGLELLSQIKQDPNLKKIPIFMLTNLETEEKIARELGANEYMLKTNIAIDELVTKIKQYLH